MLQKQSNIQALKLFRNFQIRPLRGLQERVRRIPRRGKRLQAQDRHVSGNSTFPIAITTPINLPTLILTTALTPNQHIFLYLHKNFNLKLILNLNLDLNLSLDLNLNLDVQKNFNLRPLPSTTVYHYLLFSRVSLYLLLYL